ncbi:MAG TPA: peroxiredoxin [Fibrobacteraceae bacterium]|nr:peroxiredoxin [Fibrobacteraceae bacterium]
MSVLVGKQAPDFKATAVVNGGEFVEDFTLSQFKGKKHVVLFFYPMDFTFVCPTELHAFQAKLADFEARNTQLIAVSVDSQYSHFAWLNTPVAKGGVQGVKYPMVSDITKAISRDYDVLSDGSVAFRGLFLIDKDGVVQHQVVNNLPLGRSVDEALRMVDALQFFEQNGEVCPANWHKGDKAMKADQNGLENYFAH